MKRFIEGTIDHAPTGAREKQVARGQRGQTTVEFALIAIPLFLLVVGLFDLGRAVFHHHMLSNAVREGAREGITSTPAKDVCELVVRKSFLPGMPSNPTCTTSNGGQTATFAGGDLTVTVEQGVMGDPDQPVQVEVSYIFRLITPLIANITGDALTLRASSTMLEEFTGPTPNPLTPSPTPKMTATPTPPPGTTPTSTPTGGPTSTSTPTALPCSTNTVLAVLPTSGYTYVRGIYGATVALEARLTETGGTRIQNKWITFKINGTVVGTAKTGGGDGVATLASVTLGSLLAGDYDPSYDPTVGIEAVFPGDSTYCASSDKERMVIDRASTTTTTSDTTVATSATSVTLNASIVANSPSTAAVNEGTVTFSLIPGAGCPSLGGPYVSGPVSGGTASVTVSQPGGFTFCTYTIDADYSGGFNLVGSTDTATLTVKQGTSLSVSPATGTYGGTVSLTATLTASTSTCYAGKTVTFSLNGTAVGTATTNSSGVATLSNASLGAIGAGTYDPALDPTKGIKATFAGDASCVNSNASSVLTVNKAGTTTNTPSPSTATYGTTVTLSTTVTSATAIAVNEGTVQFVVTNGGAPVCSVSGNVVNGSASAVCNVSTVPAGTVLNVQATFAETANFLGSSASGTLTVQQAATTTTVANKVVYAGSGVTLTAQVSANAPSTATVDQGTVTFTVTSGGTTICSVANVPVTVVGGVGTASTSACDVSTAPVGFYTIQASYSGGTKFLSSSGTGTLEVRLRPTSITVTVSPSPITYGNPSQTSITITATLSSEGAPLVPGTQPVTITFNGTTYNLTTNSSGVAQVSGISIAGLNAGTHAATASYAGNASYSAASGTANLTVSRANTTTTWVTAASRTARHGEVITLRVQVTANNPSTATVNEGTVTFTVKRGNDVACQEGASFSASVVNGTATATCTITGPPTSNQDYQLQAVFNQSTNFNGSSAPNGSLTVTKADTTTTPDNKTAVVNASGTTNITLTATVTANAPSVGPVNEGSATFTLKNGSGSTVGTVQTDNTIVNGAASVTYTLPSGIAPGTYTIQVSYTGGTNFNNSSGTATLTVLRSTSLTVSASPSTVSYGGSTTLTATLTLTGSTTGVSGKTISFTLNGVWVGNAQTNTSGVASLSNVSVSGLSAGATYPITATFAGDATHNSASASNTLSVGQASTSTNARNAWATVGDTGVTLIADVTATTGTAVGDGTVTFSVTSGGTTICSPAPANVTTGVASATCDISAAAAGTYSINATYSGGPNFAGSSDPTPGTLTIDKQATSLSVIASPSTVPYSGTTDLIATLVLSASGDGLSGQTITFTVNGVFQGSAVTDASGVAILAGVDLSGFAGGSTYPVVASYAGDVTYKSASASTTVTIQPAPTPTPTPTSTPTPTPTWTPSPTPTSTPEPTFTPTATPEPTWTPVPTATPEPTPEPTATPEAVTP